MNIVATKAAKLEICIIPYIFGVDRYLNSIFLLPLQKRYLLYVADFRLFFNVAAHELAVDKP